MNKNYKHKSGFSLIEMLIYIALVSIFLAGIIQFSWDIIYGRVKSQVQIEVNQNLRLAAKRINYEIRNASAINSVSGATLSLANSDPARDPTIIDLSEGRITIGQGNGGNCPVTAPCYLTSNQVSVSNLLFTDLSATDSSHLKFDLTVEAVNPGGSQAWEKSQNYSSSVELRKL